LAVGGANMQDMYAITVNQQSTLGTRGQRLFLPLVN